MSKRVLEVVVILAVIAGAFALRPHPSRPTAAPAATLDGLAPGDTFEAMVRKLGPPTCQGENQRGRFAEYGSPVLTWNGRPSVAFDRSGRATAIIGQTLAISGAVELKIGDPAGAVHLTPRTRPSIMEHHNRPEANTTEYDVANGVAVITTDSARITHLELTEDRLHQE